MAIKPKITPEKIEEFLERLNSDVEFRDRLICKTGSVLDEYGISYGPDDLVPPSEVKLPSVGEVNANRDAFREALFPDNQFSFDAPDFTLPCSTE